METEEHASELEPWLIAAYRATHYVVYAQPQFNLRIGQRSAELAAQMTAVQAQSALFITAWNPLGKDLGRAENDARQAGMRDALSARGLRWIDGFGAHPDNPLQGEVSVLVFGVDRASACELGRLHAQNAVVWTGADAIPRLLLLR